MSKFQKGLSLGFLLSLLMVVGCATVWPFRYFGASIPTRAVTSADVGKSIADIVYAEGSLLGVQGSDGWPDLPLETCQPDTSAKLKCITVPIDTFYAIKSDDQKCHADLDACQRGTPPTQ